MEVKKGARAPAFSLPDQDGKVVKLSDLKGKWVVLYFYPKDNTPGCTIEAKDFTKLLPEFRKQGAVVLGCSPDSKESHCKFIDKKGLKLTLLSDPEHKVMEKYGVWGKKKFMGREFMGVIRSTVVIDPQGRVAEVWSPVRVKNHAEDVLSFVKENA